MNSFNSTKAWLWGVAIVAGLTGSAFASHGHGGGGHHGGGGGGHHHGGGMSGGHHHGGYSGGHHHGGYSSGHHHHGGYYGGYRGGYYSGFGIGFGYPGYGYYGSPYGYGYRGYGYGGYGYGLGGYYSPNYYYSTPTYSYPSTVIVNPTPSVAAPTFDNGPIVILAPATNDKPIEYTLNGMAYTIKPGQSQKFVHDRDWIVNFDRGNGQGVATYGLKATTYKFKMTDKGWELFEAANPERPASDDPPKPIDLVKPGKTT